MNVLQSTHISVWVLEKIKEGRDRFCSDLLWCKPRVTLLAVILPGLCWSVSDPNAALHLTEGMIKLGEIRGFCHVISTKILFIQINFLGRVIDFAKLCIRTF